MEKPRLLLHVCCAPCSTHVIEVLKEKHDVEAYYYNPNIHPRKEYEKRLGEFKEYCRKIGARFHVGDYEDEEWFQKVEGHEGDEEGGERCRICYGIRLRKTAAKAKEGGCELFATTLSISPHKDAKMINTVGREAAQRYGVRFLEADFKKKGGFRKSVEMSREHGLYRQSYCGCIFSM